jgi:hypothetical protein
MDFLKKFTGSSLVQTLDQSLKTEQEKLGSEIQFSSDITDTSEIIYRLVEIQELRRELASSMTVPEKQK